MYTLIVLGIIPGTTVQITFQLWLQAAASVLAVGLMIRLGLMHRQLVTTVIIPTRVPLHASQLHLRAL